MLESTECNARCRSGMWMRCYTRWKLLMDNLNASDIRYLFLQTFQYTLLYGHCRYRTPAARTTGPDLEGHEEIAECDRDAGLSKGDLHNPVTEIYQGDITAIGFQNRAYTLTYDLSIISNDASSSIGPVAPLRNIYVSLVNKTSPDDMRLGKISLFAQLFPL